MRLTHFVNEILYEAFLKGKAIVYHNFQGVDVDENIAGSVKPLNVADCIGNEPHKDYKYFTTEKKKYVEDMIRDASGDGWKNFDPIVALPHPIKSGKYAVIDGNHRLGAFTIGKLPQINAKIISEDKVLLAERGAEWDENKVPKTMSLVDAKKQGINLKEYFSIKPLEVPSNENFKDGKEMKKPQLRELVREVMIEELLLKEATFDDIKNLSYDDVKKTFALRKKISQAILNFFPHEDHMVKVEYYGDYVEDYSKLPVKELIEYVDKRIDDNVLLNGDISIDPAKDKSPTLFIDVGENSFEITSLNDEEFFAENYADGKVKGKSRPGRVKKSGASCKGSVTDLRAKAKKYGGEKGKMYHWCANMKSGRKKK